MERFVSLRQRALSKTLRNWKEKISRRNGEVSKRFSLRSKTKRTWEKRKKEKESQVKKRKIKYSSKKFSSKIKTIKHFNL